MADDDYPKRTPPYSRRTVWTTVVLIVLTVVGLGLSIAFGDVGP